METKDWISSIGLVTTVAVALGASLQAYRNTLKLARRKDRLDRLDRQLREMYGPLYALTDASRQAWEAFRSIHRPDKDFFDPDDPPSGEDLASWRLWMKVVFQPLNEEMVDIIKGHSDLLIDETMPICLQELTAHVYAYKAILAQWDAEDFSTYTSVLNFPEEMNRYVEACYKRLKAHQLELMTT